MKKNTESIPDQFIDEKTLALLSKRDTAYLEQLFIQVNPYLSRICTANGIYKEKAEEVIHQTWERFFTNIDKFEGRSQVRTFICGILFNKIREYRRDLGKNFYEDDSENIFNNAFTIDGWWKTDPVSPQKVLELKQSSFAIQDCIEGLSEQQKAAFILREVEEENSEDICNYLNINVSHLRVLLFRAKDKLKKCLEGKISLENS